MTFTTVQMAFMFNESEELDIAMAKAVSLCTELTAFDLAEFKAGRITLAIAQFEAAVAYVKAIGGVDDDDTA